MLKVATNFYKVLFGAEEKLEFHLEDCFWEEDDKVSTSENEILDAPFSEEEIKEAIFGSYAELLMEHLDLMASPFSSIRSSGI